MSFVLYLVLSSDGRLRGGGSRLKQGSLLRRPGGLVLPQPTHGDTYR